MSTNDVRCGEPFHFFLRVTTICNRPKGHTGDHHPCMLAMDKPASGVVL